MLRSWGVGGGEGGSADFLVDGLTRQQLALGFATVVDGRFSLPWLNTAPTGSGGTAAFALVETWVT